MAFKYDLIQIGSVGGGINSAIAELNRRADDGWRFVCMFTPAVGSQAIIIEQESASRIGNV